MVYILGIDWEIKQMIAHTSNGRKMLNKVCVNCKHLKYCFHEIGVDEYCGKHNDFTNPFAICKEFEYG